MDLRLLSPIFLVLLVVVALPFLWPRTPGTDRAFRRAALRGLVFLCFVLALTDPVHVREPRESVQLVVVDTSARLSGGEVDSARSQVERLREGLEGDSRFVLVTDDAALAAAFDSDRDRVVVLDAPQGADWTELVELARTQVPDGVRAAITCLTDGLSENPADEVARFLSSVSAIPVHLVELEAERDEPRVVDLRVGRVVRGATAQAIGVLEGSGESETVVLRSVSSGRELGRLSGLSFTGRTELEFEFELEQSGFDGLELSLQAATGEEDTVSVRSLRRAVAVQDPLRVLVLEGLTGGAGDQLASLCGPGFEFETRRPDSDAEVVTENFPFADYDVVVIDDLPAESFPEPAQTALRDAVTDRGTGLLMAGGDGAFGPGGYQDSPLADVLPVGFVQREEHRDPSTTLAIIIDTSGSMGGMRVSLAKEVSRLAMQRLLPHDKVGIVEFYGAKRWAAPIQSAANRIELQRALNRLDAGGGTVILPAIEEAYYALQNVQTRYRHVLILTDGGVERGAFEPLVRSMADEGITVSTVLIGPQAHSEFLVQIANWGRGRFYSVPNRFNLPELLLKQPSTAKLPAYRPGSHQVQPSADAGGLGDLDFGSMPQLSGYVETEARSGTELLLETVQQNHPVAATWRYGLGRVSVFTSELTGRGTEGFESWNDFGEFAARFLERTASDLRRPFDLLIRRERDRATVIAERRSTWGQRPSGVLTLVAEGAPSSDGAGVSLDFVQTAPGRFESTVSVGTDEDRELRVYVSADSPTSTERAVSDRFDGRRPERQVDSIRRLDLAGLAQSQGTSFALRADWDGAPAQTAVRGRPVAFTHLWPWLCALGLLAYLADVYLRRRPVALVAPASTTSTN
ncbi:MAG: VWA domain-containing protein [Planctomycetota bacterium]